MAPSQRSTKKEIEQADPVIIESSFMLEQIQLKDMSWSAKVRIVGILPRAYHNYGIKMLFDEKPYIMRIDRLKEKIDNAKSAKKLFKDMEQEDIDDIKDEIKDVEKEMSEIKRQCLTIDFPATVEQLKYSNGNTMITIHIPDNVIEPMNKVKRLFQYYKVELKPIF